MRRNETRGKAGAQAAQLKSPLHGTAFQTGKATPRDSGYQPNTTSNTSAPILL